VKFLTRQEQQFLIVVLALLLVGLFVKYYRASHPSETGTPATTIVE
jgi:hypothetical protein